VPGLKPIAPLPQHKIISMILVRFQKFNHLWPTKIIMPCHLSRSFVGVLGWLWQCYFGFSPNLRCHTFLFPLSTSRSRLLSTAIYLPFCCCHPGHLNNGGTLWSESIARGSWFQCNSTFDGEFIYIYLFIIGNGARGFCPDGGE
jgi:hypothetical protein